MILTEETEVLGETPVSVSLCSPQSHMDWHGIELGPLRWTILRTLIETDLYETEVILGAFAKLRKATVSFVVSFCLSLSAWKKSSPTGLIFTKFYIEDFSKICLGNSSFIKIWQ